MKNLTLLLILLSWLPGAAQLQNANWVFGEPETGFTFNTLFPSFFPVPALTSTSTFILGVASVSDSNGNLLFTTDGTSLWVYSGSTFTLVTNQLLGADCTQGTIIVPRPNHPNNYYIVTNSGYPSFHGLYWSEIDLSLPVPQMMVSLNTPLLTDNGIPINNLWGNGNLSGAVTSTVHSDGVQYWVVAHVQNSTANSGKMFTYLVTPNGIGSSISGPNYPEKKLNLHVGPPNLTISAAMAFVKISPDASRIAFCGEGNVYPGGNLWLGNFNNGTGDISITNTVSAAPIYGAYGGLEFSPDSKVLYDYYDTMVNGTSSSYIERRILTTFGTPATNSIPIGGGFRGMQLGLDGKIYVTSDSNSNPNLYRISNPNSTTQTTFISSFATFPAGSAGNYLSLPQWVHLQKPLNCQPLVLQSETHTANFTYQNHNTITTTGNYSFTAPQVDPDLHISMQASQSVLLLPDTYIRPKLGSYLAKIRACDTPDTVVPVNRSVSDDTTLDETQQSLVVFPNPTKGGVTVKTSKAIVEITISRLSDGRIVLSQKTNNETESLLDLYKLDKGIYIVNAVTSQGDLLTQKLIKY